MPITYEKILTGDLTEFSKLYSDVFEKIYHVAYYSLANEREAITAVTEAARWAYDNAESCKNAEELKELMLKKTCERIVACFREYRKTAPTYDPFQPYLKTQMIRLTDAERLSVIMWAVFGYEADKISALTGLAQDIVAKKLESGQTKISAKLQ